VALYLLQRTLSASRRLGARQAEASRALHSVDASLVHMSTCIVQLPAENATGAIAVSLPRCKHESYGGDCTETFASQRIRLIIQDLVLHSAVERLLECGGTAHALINYQLRSPRVLLLSRYCKPPSRPNAQPSLAFGQSDPHFALARQNLKGW
jgi:hypothetical protein